MKNLAITFALGLAIGSCSAVGPAALTVFDVAAPIIGDALGQLVRERWGDAAKVDRDSSRCFRTTRECGPELVGDDDEEFVYTTCGGKAVGE